MGNGGKNTEKARGEEGGIGLILYIVNTWTNKFLYGTLKLQKDLVDIVDIVNMGHIKMELVVSLYETIICL